MRTLTTTFLALLLCFMLPTGEAHAKKLGGGSTLGKTYTAPKQPVAPTSSNTSSTTATKQDATAAAGTTATKPRSGFGGLMGGLLAGGLLGALFFGGAFEGIQIMDVLLIALVGFVAFMLFKQLASRRTTPQPQPAYAGAGMGNTQEQWRQSQAPTPEPVMARDVPRTPEFGGGLNGGLAEAQLALPAWFNKKAFLEQACTHYTHLQRAWDRQDWAEIESYTSAELCDALKRERAKLPSEQETRVESVMAEVINFIDEGAQVIVSIHFYGWMREDDSAGTAEFSEIWHLSRDMSADNADWFIVGIEQP